MDGATAQRVRGMKNMSHAQQHHFIGGGGGAGGVGGSRRRAEKSSTAGMGTTRNASSVAREVAACRGPLPIHLASVARGGAAEALGWVGALQAWQTAAARAADCPPYLHTHHETRSRGGAYGPPPRAPPPAARAHQSGAGDESARSEPCSQEWRSGEAPEDAPVFLR